MKRGQRAWSVCCDSTAPKLEDCTGWIRADRLTHCIVLQRFRFRCHGIVAGCIALFRYAASVRFSPGLSISICFPCWQTAQSGRDKQSLTGLARLFSRMENKAQFCRMTRKAYSKQSPLTRTVYAYGCAIQLSMIA